MGTDARRRRAIDDRAYRCQGSRAPFRSGIRETKAAKSTHCQSRRRLLISIAPADRGTPSPAASRRPESLRSKPPRARLDEFLHGRRADELRLFFGLLSRRLGMVEAGRRAGAHRGGSSRRDRSDTGRCARRCAALEARPGGGGDRDDRGLGSSCSGSSTFAPTGASSYLRAA
jgi:hypothetical protein